jgi:3-oxoacyl-[acyl-carrier-protein] synthase III
MAEKSQSIWREIAADKWCGACVFGDGSAAVVVRCAGAREVHLFSTMEEAKRFRLQLCANLPCESKHNIGSLTQFVPAIAKPRGENLRAYLQAEP